MTRSTYHIAGVELKGKALRVSPNSDVDDVIHRFVDQCQADGPFSATLPSLATLLLVNSKLTTSEVVIVLASSVVNKVTRKTGASILAIVHRVGSLGTYKDPHCECWRPGHSAHGEREKTEFQECKAGEIDFWKKTLNPVLDRASAIPKNHRIDSDMLKSD